MCTGQPKCPYRTTPIKTTRFLKNQSLKARVKVKQRKKAARKTTPTSKYVNLVEELYFESAKLKEG